jgi:ankyrin repeat protein
MDATCTALQRACSERKAEIVDLLISSGARACKMGAAGLTALHCSARAGPAKLVESLLAAQADPMQANSADGTLPVELVSMLTTRDSWRVAELLREKTVRAAPLTGWLTKLAGDKRNWKRRFCVLTSTDAIAQARPILPRTRSCPSSI